MGKDRFAGITDLDEPLNSQQYLAGALGVAAFADEGEHLMVIFEGGDALVCIAKKFSCE